MAVKMGWMPWSITHASDVGMSYGALAALGALTATIPRRWRSAWIGWWISVSVTAAIIGADFTNAGHAVAVTLGVLVSLRFRAPIHWTPVRCLMLLGSAGFGFLMLAHSTWGMAGGIVFGLSGALVAHALTAWLGSGASGDVAVAGVSEFQNMTAQQTRIPFGVESQACRSDGAELALE
jgi:hypothetical protein